MLHKGSNLVCNANKNTELTALFSVKAPLESVKEDVNHLHYCGRRINSYWCRYSTFLINEN
jgi:hypothetical protein